MINSVELDERIGKCQKILDVDPNSQIFAALAEAYRKKGDLDKAFRICQNGLKVHPSYGSAHIVMAKINLDRGLYDWAEIEAKKAADIDGRTRTIELLLAEIAIYKGEFNAAIKLLKKLGQSDPNNTEIKRLIEIAQKIPEEHALYTSVAAENNQSQAAAGPTPVEAASDSSQGLTVRGLIESAIKVPGLDGVLFTNSEGLLVDSEWTLRIDASVCAATMGSVGEQLNQELMKASFGRFKIVLIESVSTTYYLVRVHNGLFLFAANASANLGALRMKIENLLVLYR